jgi:putative SOS response-associated peptidase YedK
MLQDDGVQIEDAVLNGSSEAHHQTYNFAPGNNGVICRANTLPSGAEVEGKYHSASENKSLREGASSLEDRDEVIKYFLQSMKWGILPSWSKQNNNPNRGVINCRDDSLRTTGGMWQAIKARKRCIVVAQGFFEWLNVSGKEKHPYFIKRKDGRLMCFAGLWDSIHQGMILNV